MNTRNLSTKKLNNSFIVSGHFQELASSCAQVQKPVTDLVIDSHDALLLTEALQVAQNTTDIRADKVEKLRAQIAAGTYEIDNYKLACAILGEEPQLFRF